MKDLVKTIVQAIVNNPDSVVVEERESVDFPGLTIIYISVAPEDAGIVIGKRGRTIDAIRSIVSIAAIRSNKRVRVVFNESDKADDNTTDENKSPEETHHSDSETTDDILEDDL